MTFAVILRYPQWSVSLQATAPNADRPSAVTNQCHAAEQWLHDAHLKTLQPPAILHYTMAHEAKAVYLAHSPAWENASVLHCSIASALLVRSSVKEAFSRESRHIKTSPQYQMHWIPQMQEPQYLLEALGPRFQWGTNSQVLPKAHIPTARRAEGTSAALSPVTAGHRTAFQLSQWHWCTSVPFGGLHRCPWPNWKMAALPSCQWTFIWPVVFAFLVATTEERSQVDCHSPSWVCGYDNLKKGKKKKKKEAKVSPMSSSTHSHCHLLPHSQVLKVLQCPPAGSGVLKGYHTENWLCLRTLPSPGQVVQKVAPHHLAEGCTQTLEKFLPGEQPLFSTAQSTTPPPRPAKRDKPFRTSVNLEQEFAKQTFLCLGMLVWKPTA